MKAKTADFLSIRGVPHDLQHRFKICCVRNDRSMKEAIIDLMTSYCEMDEDQVMGCDTGPESHRTVKFEEVKR